MTTHVINAEGGVDDIVNEIGDPDNPGIRPEVGDRCLRCAEVFKQGQHAITFDVWDIDPTQGLTGVHFHARCAEELVSALIQDVARLVDKEDVGLYTAARHKQLSTALATLLVAGAPKVLTRRAKRRLTE